MMLRAMGCVNYQVHTHYNFILSSEVPEEFKYNSLTALYTQTPGNPEQLFGAISDNSQRFADV